MQHIGIFANPGNASALDAVKSIIQSAGEMCIRDSLRTEQAARGKLYGTLGVLFGMAAAILAL